MVTGIQALRRPAPAMGRPGPMVASWLLLAALGACSAELSPVEPVLVRSGYVMADPEPLDLRFQAPADTPVRITVAGRGVDVRAAILGPNPAEVTVDAPNRRMGIETLLVEPPHDGVIALRITQNDHRQARGEVFVEAVALPVATAADRRRLAATRLEAAACRLFPDPARGRESAEAFAAAAALHEAIGDPASQGAALLHAAGAHYLRLDDWHGAAGLAGRARKALALAGTPGPAAYALRVEGAALDMAANTGHLDDRARAPLAGRARDRLTRAADEFTALGMHYEAGYALNYRGVSFHESGERARARADYRQALRHFRSAGDRPAQALSLQSLAQIEYEDGRLADATRQFEAALRLIPQDEEPLDYALTLQNSAYPLRILGRFEEALARFFEAGRILRGLGERSGEARSLHGMATVLLHAGDRDRARELLQASVKLQEDTGARREQALSLLVLGNIEREAGQSTAAIELHRRAEGLVRTTRDRAKIKLALAQDFLAAGRLPPARAALDELLALQLPASHRERGTALAEMGTLEARLGHWAAADAAFARALAVHELNGSELEQARTFRRRAEAKYLQRDLGATLADADAALRLFENVGIAGTQADGRLAFRSSYRGATELRVAALLDQSASARRRGDSAGAQRLLQAAFASSDRARAHLLTDGGGDAGGSEHVPPEWLARRRELYELLVGQRLRQERLLDREERDAAALAAVEKDITMLRTEAALIEGRIAGRSSTAPSAAAVSPAALVRAVPPGMRLIEFFIGERRGWRFEVQDGQVSAHELADLGQLDSTARRLHESWRTPAAAPDDRDALGRTLAHLAFAPIADAPRAGRLLIVPDGALHLVPLALLASRHWPERAPGSALVVPSLGATLPDRDRHPAPDMLLAIVADPVFTRDDPRLVPTRESGSPAAPPIDLFLTRASRNLGAMRRLPSTAVEASEIVRLAGDASGVLALVGLEASRSRIESSALERFRILHFATHAVADSRDPALAMLALSRWDPDGRPLDGALRLHDISHWRLNAELVVLSGCETAVGREVAGEGPLGLSQAFLQAGARSVVATLWQVPDTSTAALMREFYRHLLAERREPAVALQLAQDSVRRHARWSDPYYWAGFQLVSTAPARAARNSFVTARE